MYSERSPPLCLHDDRSFSPADWSGPLVGSWHVIVSEEHQYVFIQYPHSGSTAVGAELMENYNGREILEKHSTFADLKFEFPTLAQNYFVFTGIRHPLDDAVAMYWKLATRDKYTNPENWVRHGGFVSERGV